jgi:transcriptional regulator with XRE-family HTH domain
LRLDFLFLVALFHGEIWGKANLTFRNAQVRLLAYVRDRIHNGELTERGFARMIGISQPHVHNVLKGVRNLSVEISDSILKILHISILDLLSPEDLEISRRRRKALEPVLEVPFLDTAIGPGIPWPARIDRRNRFPSPFPTGILPPALVMARLAPDAQMGVTLGGYDIAMLDTSELQRTKPSPEGLYAVERGGEVVLRYLRPGARCYYLVTDAALENPAQWEHLSMSQMELPGLIKARVLWLGREKNRKLPMHQRGRFLNEEISS